MILKASPPDPSSLVPRWRLISTPARDQEQAANESAVVPEVAPIHPQATASGLRARALDLGES
jgi:hypothetical protein